MREALATLRAAGRDARRRLAAALALRHRRLLPHRARRGLVQPRPLRRRPLRPARRRGGAGSRRCTPRRASAGSAPSRSAASCSAPTRSRAGYYDAYYLRAQKVRTLVRRDFDEAFERCDVVAGPVAPSVAFRLGEKTADPLQMYLADVFTITATSPRCPACRVPCGLERESGLPVGLQLVGRPFDEATLLRAARALEREAGPLPAPGPPDAEGRAMTRRIATLVWAALLVVPIALPGRRDDARAPHAVHRARARCSCGSRSSRPRSTWRSRAFCRLGSRPRAAAGARR